MKSIARFTVSRSDCDNVEAALNGIPDSSFAVVGAVAGGRVRGSGACREGAAASVAPAASASTAASAQAVFLREFFRINCFPDRIIQFVCLTVGRLQIAKPPIMAMQRWEN